MSFVRYNTDDQVVSSETVVRGLWSQDEPTLASFYTASNNTQYYLNVYNTATTESLQFAIQYGTLNGSGSTPINSLVPGATPTRIVYGEYRNLVYGTENNNFVFNGSTVSNGIYAINIARSRYKESLQPGSLELKLSASLTLIDDSTTTNLSRFIGENRYYNIISGSLTDGAYSTATNYGFFFPDMGLLILNSGSLTANISGTGSGALLNSIKIGNGFRLQSSETVSSTYFFTRVKNSEFNYTTNPSIIDDNGNLLYTTLINNPQTFPTSVGLYNDNNELLAVAKLSRPLTKDFTKEALIRIKLDY